MKLGKTTARNSITAALVGALATLILAQASRAQNLTGRAGTVLLTAATPSTLKKFARSRLKSVAISTDNKLYLSPLPGNSSSNST